MKVMLINPNLRLSSKRYSRFVRPLLPMGIASIAAVLEKKGFEVTLLDQYANKMTNEKLLEKINTEAPQLVGFSCLTSVMSNVRTLVEQIRLLKKDIKIVLGNIHATIFTDELLKEEMADIIVRGEGEYSTLEVAQALKNGRSLQGIKGISYLQDGKVYHNPDKELIEDLDELPYPAWHLLNLRNYRNFPSICIYNAVVPPIQASRGCPYRCTFCSQDKTYKRPRYRRTERIIEEVEYLHSRFNIRYFGIYDAYFPFSIKQGLEFCDEFIKRGLHKKIRWITEARVDKVNLELLMRMKEAGAHLIMYGLESGNQRVLDSLRKKTTLEQARRAARDTKKAGILSFGLFMLGMPGETEETCEDTIRFAKELDCDLVKFNIAVPFPGSEFFESCKGNLNLDNVDRLEKFNSWTDWISHSTDLIYVPEGMTSRKLLNLQRKAMFQFYMRPKVILRNIIKRTVSFKDLYYGGQTLINNYFKIHLSKLRNKHSIRRLKRLRRGQRHFLR